MRTTIIILALLLTGCDTLHSAGIGGEPRIYCRQGEAVLDDRIIGPDAARLSVVRRIPDGDPVCLSPIDR